MGKQKANIKINPILLGLLLLTTSLLVWCYFTLKTTKPGTSPALAPVAGLVPVLVIQTVNSAESTLSVEPAAKTEVRSTTLVARPAPTPAAKTVVADQGDPVPASQESDTCPPVNNPSTLNHDKEFGPPVNTYTACRPVNLSG